MLSICIELDMEVCLEYASVMEVVDEGCLAYMTLNCCCGCGCCCC